MNIHEYQAKEILKRYGVAVPRGIVATTPDEAEAAARELGTPVVVVKAQIHAGGRGKAGGVKVVKGPVEAREAAAAMLGSKLVTHQTGPAGKEVLKVYVEEGCDIAQELYLGIVVDRATGFVTIMASTEGGMEIEEVAAKTPEKILKQPVDPAVGLMGFHTRKLAYGLGLKGDAAKNAQKFIAGLYRAFVDTDASLAEINPLVVTGDGQVLALDAKMNFDNNALYRHKDIEALRDETEEDPRELEASRFGLSYISLDGSIGCMVNGAGLAMATMDIIKHYGAEPANFLDVGGGASAEQVTRAFQLILSDPKVEAVLVNIFGGIMRCDTIAEGIITAAKTVDLRVPLVVRLQGTNVELGRKMLAESGLPIITAETMSEAAEKVVAAARN
ncbi:ADP-forming succinate--CoA ligase subunit beta [Deferrisoma camini]|uniref:ADP-forming succinate--CoA ligase subunit beta n=1 Tax=Deferrisoma camini TaxID=1035120 RepID=UPI00046CCE28|nr:ADP-forming succinate--CoA ligase subunit beta [Deferrisoma camini]